MYRHILRGTVKRAEPIRNVHGRYGRARREHRCAAERNFGELTRWSGMASNTPQAWFSSLFIN